MHCDDAELLEWLDGECDRGKANAIASHLRECWLCRARKEELEKAICAVARLHESDSQYPATRLDQMRQQFLRRTQAVTVDVAKPRWRMGLGAGLLAVAATLALLLLWPTRESIPQGRDPVLALRQSQTLEALQARDLSTGYLAEIEVARTGRPDRVVSTRIRVASEGSNGKKRVGQALTRKPLQATVGAWWRIAEEAASDNLDAQVAGWIQAHAWEPVLLSTNFAVFVERTGASLTLRKAGPATYELVAEREMADGRWQVAMELRQDDFRPVSLSVNNDRKGGWRIKPLAVRRLSKAEALAMFVPPGGAPVPEVQQLPDPPAENESSMGSLVQALQVLHTTGACTRESVELRQMAGAVVVEVTTASASRKRELQAAFAAIEGVKVVLHSQEDPVDGPHLPVVVHTPTGSQPVAAIAGQQQLKLALNTEDQRLLVAWADRTVQLSERSIAHATALRRIVQAFRENAAVTSLTGFQREMLTAILLDHASALRMELQGLQVQVEQFSAEPIVELSEQARTRNWRERLQAWLDAVETLHREVYALFTIGGTGGSIEGLRNAMAQAKTLSIRHDPDLLVRELH